MQYQIPIIESPGALPGCPLFYMDQFNWGGDYRPVSYGRMGFVPGKGFCVTLTCEERDPVRTYTKPNSDVYRDSAMEAFLCLDPGAAEPVYLNFEMNALGTLLCAYGNSQTGRTFISPRTRKDIVCNARIDADFWSIFLFIPLSVIEEAYPAAALHPERGSRLSLNFFKIKESEDMMHFASFAPIDHPTPCFHLPGFFAEAVIGS